MLQGHPIFLIKSNYMDAANIHKLYSINPLIPHMACMIGTRSRYNFLWLKDTNANWATQTSIFFEKQKAMLACLFH